MKLKELIKDLDQPAVQGSLNLDIFNIAYDSRKVKSQGIFIAVPGFNKDGTQFVSQAIQNGAKVIVSEKALKLPDGITQITVKSARKALARLANRFYDFPSRKLKIIAVTGTNGKTTTVHLIESILRHTGKRVGMIGTVGVSLGNDVISASLTTPDSLDLQAILSDFVNKGCTHVVMEVSSHSLALHRVMGTEFDIAVFTNLTHDHLDFHKMMSNYITAKKKLFDWLGKGEKKDTIAIINQDDTYAEAMVEDYAGKVDRYGLKNAKVISMDLSQMQFEAMGIKIKSNLVGEFNIYNYLAAIKVALNLGLEHNLIENALTKFEGVPGRLEKINLGQPFEVIIDFAHSPDSLERLLKSIKKYTKGKLLLLFGCPGDRDRTKRPLMGEIASKLADYSIITTDDPHFERPEAIVNEIEKGFFIKKAKKKNYKKIVDRRKAINEIINMAKSNDVVIIAGRGHEQFQDFGGKKIPLDDREESRRILSSMSSQLSMKAD